MQHVMIVDDEPSICWGFREFLTDEGYEVSIAASAEDALRLAENRRPDAVVLDIRLPGMDGLAAMPQLRDRIGDAPIIVITAFGNLETAVQALSGGAFDYLWKPFDLDQAAAVLQRALQAAEKASAVESPAGQRAPATSRLIGSSLPMQQIFKQIALVAPSDVPVLITGESGTGKELVARAIHQHSPRQSGPFVPICLAALSPTLVESELFGHVAGAFTGATQDRAGLLELAAGGTVLLDEIADTTPALQVKLLRAIEQREITRVGDARPRPIDVRLLAATNRPIAELIRTGEFREDFYFRIGVFRLELPSLRDRKDDIPVLAEHFLAQIRPASGPLHFATSALQELVQRAWPGNVRELRNAVEHAAIIARGGVIDCSHLPAPSGVASAESPNRDHGLQHRLAEWARAMAVARDVETPAELYERYLELVEPPLLKQALDSCDQNRAAAAELLGLHRTTLRQKLRKYGLG